MKLVAELDENKQAYIIGYISSPQLPEPQRIKFYLDSGCTITTILDIDVVRLGINWRGFKQTVCDTAAGKAYPFIMPEATVLLKSIENTNLG